MAQLSPILEIEAHAWTLLTEAATSGRAPRRWLMPPTVFELLRQQVEKESGQPAHVTFVEYMGLPISVREVSSLTLESRL